VNLRTIPTTAVRTSLRLARLPLNAAISLLPGNGGGPKGKARSAVDRADATRTTDQAEAQVQKRAEQAEATVEEAIEQAAPEARLKALDAQAEAETDEQEALVEKDEAHRLGEAAAEIKGRAHGGLSLAPRGHGIRSAAGVRPAESPLPARTAVLTSRFTRVSATTSTRARRRSRPSRRARRAWPCPPRRA
jgi:hypothetical protein